MFYFFRFNHIYDENFETRRVTFVHPCQPVTHLFAVRVMPAMLGCQIHPERGQLAHNHPRPLNTHQHQTANMQKLELRESKYYSPVGKPSLNEVTVILTSVLLTRKSTGIISSISHG